MRFSVPGRLLPALLLAAAMLCGARGVPSDPYQSLTGTTWPTSQ